MRIFLYLFGVIIYMSNHVASVAGEDDNPLAPAGKTPVAMDSASISLDSKSQQLAGLKVEPLVVVHQQPELVAYGTVLSHEYLLQLRQQFLVARAQQDSAKAKYSESQLNLSRTKALQLQGIVSTRRLQEQQALSLSDKANLDASGYQQQTIIAASRLEWGDILTEWFVLTQSKDAEQFIKHGTQLMLITLPANAHLRPGVQSIYIDDHGQRNTATKAILISASPKVDPVSQGERYFVKTEGRQIPVGSHITAWIGNEVTENTGVMIPKSALVWHLGQAFVFTKTSDHLFNRRPIAEFIPDKEGYFVTGNQLQPGEEIVITGAQTLLSQQLKVLIPSEDKD